MCVLKGMQDMMALYEASKSKLNANDTYTQVSINACIGQMLSCNSHVTMIVIGASPTLASRLVRAPRSQKSTRYYGLMVSFANVYV